MEDILVATVFNDDEDDDVDEAVILHIRQGNGNLVHRALLYGEKDDIIRLSRALNIPHRINTPDRISVSGPQGLCMLLRRLAYPNRLLELESFFGLSSTAISSVVTTVINIISDNHGQLLENIGNMGHFFNREKLVQYSQVFAI
ncbi:hypothetical protein FQR65_LT18449 [Abscondita terminalis]|nr:hypothetical protein FQR65_LT18449 [Abscondita terminalis]